MSLLSKLAVLVGLLVATAAMGIGASLWGVRALSRDIAVPYERLTSALSHLNDTKRDVWELLTLLKAAGPAPLPIARRDGHSLVNEQPRDVLARLTSRAAALDGERAFLSRVGLGAWRTVRERVELAALASARAVDAPDDTILRAHAANALFELHELLERAEARTLEDSRIAADFGARMQRLILIVMAISTAASFAAAALALVMIRRWIVQPVSRLRAGADRIALGDFSYRVPVTGRDELALLAAEFNQMAATVSALQDERVARERLAAVGEVVQRIVHNLRNPLAGIRGLAELTRDDLPVHSELRENQSRILSTVDQFERWVRELLQSTSPAQVRREPTPVRPIFENVRAALAPMAEAREVNLVLDLTRCPDHADLDRRHFEHALIALITNAIEAAPPSTAVHVAAALDPTSADHWQVFVADDGPGVPDNLRSRIFEPQFTTKRGGTGIGLALVSQVVRAHSGCVTVDDARNVPPTAPRAVLERSGGVFVMRLPLVGSREATTGQPLGATGGENSHHRGRGQPTVHRPPQPLEGGT